MPQPKVFVLRLDHRLDQSLRENIVGIGWFHAKRLLELDDWEVLKSHLRESYTNLENAQALGNAAGSVWRFLKSIGQGDLLIIPVPGAFYVARVESDPFYELSGATDDLDYAYRRRVVWETSKPVPRSHASATLRRWMKARQTCVGPCVGGGADSDLCTSLNEALERTTPIDFGSSVLDAAFGPVSKALRDAVSDQGLEQIVRRLAQASGAEAEIPPKNSGLPGDVDVLATYDLKIGGAGAAIEVAYQVKQHEGESSDWGVQQLVDRMEASPTIVRGCLVTTASKVSKQARTLADENGILVLTERELVEWVLSIGLGALVD